MLSFLKKTVTGHPIVDPRDTLVQDEFAKQRLRKHLALVIKKLQCDHIHQDASIERNDETALWLCSIFEAIFLHGYQGKMKVQPLKLLFDEDKTSKEIYAISFWDALQSLTHKNIIAELKDMAVASEIGLCRAWIRLALNDNLMESYLESIILVQDEILSFYSPNAFLVDKELLGITKELLQGISEFQFHLNYNSPKLNMWDRRSLYLGGFLKASDAEEEHEWSEKQMRQGLARNSFATGIQPHQPTTTTTTTSSNVPYYSVSNNHTQPFILDSTPVLKENDKSSGSDDFDPSADCQSPILEPNLASGNKLSTSVTPWSGWSSAFEDFDDTDSNTQSHVDVPHSGDVGSEPMSRQSKEKYESFGALLSVYGENSQHTDIKFPAQNSNRISTEDDATMNQLEDNDAVTSPSKDSNVDELNYEVIPSSSLSHPDKHTQFLLSNVIQISHENGLDAQNFQCNDCGKSIGLIYGSYRICHFDGRYYCSDCHANEEHVIPGRILQNWDFRPRLVSKANLLFLLKNEEEPMFNLDEINPTLYNSILTLSELKMTRIQLQHVKGYLSTCRKDIAEEFRRRIWPREYLCEDIHQYSLLDFIQVNTGQLASHLKKIVLHFTKHIYRCSLFKAKDSDKKLQVVVVEKFSLCSQKGFVCEICKDPNIIYPFEVHASVQCNRCLSLYHKQCRKGRGRCPKCARMRLRSHSKH